MVNAYAGGGGPGQLQFEFSGLAPGAYTAWAFTNSAIEYRDPEFLRNLPAGVSVQIDGDDPKEITLTSIVRNGVVP